MEIKRIRLRDFRQFYGDQTIELATDPNRNVTLIHAENGVGKTTILNSVLWTFFGITTKKFEQRERIVNFEAEKNGVTGASVDVVFTHEGNEYLASRAHSINGTGSNRARFSVMKLGATGAVSAPLPNPDAFINSVVPSAMAPYFFFDGEQAETFASEMNNKTIAAAIRNILGSTLIETAIDDLNFLGKKYNEEVGATSGDSKISAIEKRITDLEATKESRKQKIDALKDSIDNFTGQLSEIDKKLSEAKEASQLQRQREDKKATLKVIQGQIKDTRSDVLKWISNKAFQTVSAALTSQSLDFIDEESLRGRIPSPYNEDFVKGLLETQKCVCERPLSPGSSEWKAITALLSSAGNADVLGRVVRVRARIQMLKEQRADAPQLLDSLQEKVAQLLIKQNELEREIEEIGKKIEGLPIAEIQERERARKTIEGEIERSKTTRIREIRDNEYAQDEITRLNREVTELAYKNVVARGLIARRDLSIRGAKLLEGFLTSNEQRARRDIQDSVNRVLAITTRKHYTFEVDESFNIRLLFPDGTPTPKSGGENQMMSLAFLSALIEYAKKRSSSTEDLFIPATVAPLVLDSPFGQLDDAYRGATAAFVPSMAPQVVLLVSSSQGKDEVYRALEKRIGAEYVLVAHNSQPAGLKKEEFRDIRGERVATTLFGQERTMTQVRKVSI